MKRANTPEGSTKIHPSTTRTLSSLDRLSRREKAREPRLPVEENGFKKTLAAIALAVSASVGAIYMSCSGKPEEPDIVETRSVATPVISEKKKVLLENKERIDQLEEAFIKFVQKISENAKIYLNPAESALVGIPLEVMKGNRDNKTKDLSLIHNLTKKEGKSIIITLDSPKHFHYSFNKVEEGVGASFFDPSREITLNKEFSVENIKDLFFLYHELIHTKDDEIRRDKRRYPEYAKTLSFMTKNNVNAAFLDDEIRATGITLMAMNVYFKGKLAALGEKAYAEDIAELFGVSLEGATKVSTDYIDLVTMQTRVFYNSKATQEEKALKWRTLIASMYLNAGKKLYGIDQNGAPFPLANP